MKITLKSFQDLAQHADRFLALADDFQNIIVTRHAIERMKDWQRVRGNDISDKEAEWILKRAVLDGKEVGKRPGEAREIVFRDLFVLIRKDQRDPESGNIIVLTVNGDRVWRNWYRKTHIAPRYRAKCKAAL